jgi:hypothetical protein
MRVHLVARLAFVVTGLLWAGIADAQWGTIKGQIVVEGDFPKRPNLIPGLRGVANVPDETVVIDPKTKGLANAVIWLAKTPTQVHPELVKSKAAEVVFDHRGFRYVPHVLFVRTDQQVRVLSADPVVHNMHTYPLKNAQENFHIQPNDRKGILVTTVTKAERLPVRIGCDIHPWMQGWWVILDHPYAAVTNERGQFEIANLPVGEHEFRIWQEKAGYLDRDCQITVKEGGNELPSLVYPALLFK